MDALSLIHLLPTLEMLSDGLCEAGLPCRIEGDPAARRFRAARVFAPGMALAEDVLGDAGSAALTPEQLMGLFR